MHVARWAPQTSELMKKKLCLRPPQRLEQRQRHKNVFIVLPPSDSLYRAVVVGAAAEATAADLFATLLVSRALAHLLAPLRYETYLAR